MKRPPGQLEREVARWARAPRPARIEPCGPDQESVWDYPRPPRTEPVSSPVRVVVQGIELACTDRALRVCETAGPPTYYVPAVDVRTGQLTPVRGHSFCEWKGDARYWTLTARPGVAIAWSYDDPFEEYASLAGAFSFFADRVEAWVGGVRARAQPGGYYGGWVTPDLAGPFKGVPGSEGW